jgi:nicotinic acid mononucleotide adenylyltransferase
MEKKRKFKYVNLNPELTEITVSRAVFTFGRFNPPHVGHELLINKCIQEGQKQKASVLIFVSHTEEKDKNPLSYDKKLSYLTRAFGSIIRKTNSKTIIEILKELERNGYKEIFFIVGSDRVKEFSILLNKYNHKEYTFDKIEVISAGSRDPDSNTISGISSTKMKEYVKENNLKAFTAGLPTKLKPYAVNIFKDVKEGLSTMSTDVIDIFEEIEEERQPLNITQRRKKSLQMRRFKNRLKVGREKARKRMASPEKLKVRARRKALDILRHRLMKNKDYTDMSNSEKIALDKRLLRMPKSIIARIATKQLPIVRKAEIQRLADLHKPDVREDLNERFESFLENFTPKYKRMFTKEGPINIDKRFKIFKTRKQDHILELYNLIEKTEKTLDKNDPKNREWGTDSLVKILKSDTPGQ